MPDRGEWETFVERGYMKRPIRIVHALPSVLLLAVLAGACGDLGPVDERFDELDRQEAKWQAARPAQYRFGLARICFCAPESLGPVRITVSGEDVTERRYIASGDPVPESLEAFFPSIDGLFDLLRDAIERDAHRIDVTYDPVSGVPIDLYIDYEVNVADEEVGYEVVESVAPPPAR